MSDPDHLIEVLLMFFVLTTALVMYQLFKRLPVLVYRYVTEARAADQRVEQRFREARALLDEHDALAAFLQDAAERIMPLIMSQANRLTRRIQRLTATGGADHLVIETNRILVRTEQIRNEYLALTKTIVRSVKAAKANPAERERIVAHLRKLHDEFEAVRHVAYPAVREERLLTPTNPPAALQP